MKRTSVAAALVFRDLAFGRRPRSDDRGGAAVLVIEGRADVDPIDDASSGRSRLYANAQRRHADGAGENYEDGRKHQRRRQLRPRRAAAAK